jgi:hypothetical protein
MCEADVSRHLDVADDRLDKVLYRQRMDLDLANLVAKRQTILVTLSENLLTSDPRHVARGLQRTIKRFKLGHRLNNWPLGVHQLERHSRNHTPPISKDLYVLFLHLSCNGVAANVKGPSADKV